jgi:hypothetical protein
MLTPFLADSNQIRSSASQFLRIQLATHVSYPFVLSLSFGIFYSVASSSFLSYEPRRRTGDWRAPFPGASARRARVAHRYTPGGPKAHSTVNFSRTARKRVICCTGCSDCRHTGCAYLLRSSPILDDDVRDQVRAFLSAILLLRRMNRWDLRRRM